MQILLGSIKRRGHISLLTLQQVATYQTNELTYGDQLLQFVSQQQNFKQQIEYIQNGLQQLPAVYQQDQSQLAKDKLKLCQYGIWMLQYQDCNLYNSQEKEKLLKQIQDTIFENQEDMTKYFADTYYDIVYKTYFLMISNILTSGYDQQFSQAFEDLQDLLSYKQQASKVRKLDYLTESLRLLNDIRVQEVQQKNQIYNQQLDTYKNNMDVQRVNGSSHLQYLNLVHKVKSDSYVDNFKQHIQESLKALAHTETVSYKFDMLIMPALLFLKVQNSLKGLISKKEDVSIQLRDEVEGQLGECIVMLDNIFGTQNTLNILPLGLLAQYYSETAKVMLAEGMFREATKLININKMDDGLQVDYRFFHPSINAWISWSFAQLLYTLPNRDSELKAWKTLAQKEAESAQIDLDKVFGSISKLKGQGQRGNQGVIEMFTKRLYP